MIKLGAFADFRRVYAEMRLPGDEEESLVDYVKATRDPHLWDEDGDVRPEVKAEILSRLTDALNKTEWKEIDLDLYIMGSITGRQYTAASDIDVHLVVELPADEIEAMNEHFKDTVNDQPLEGTEHPINYYAISASEKERHFETADGVYDLLGGEWVVTPEEPDPYDPEVRYKKQLAKAKKIGNKFVLLLAEVERDIKDLKEIEDFGIEGDYEKTHARKLREIEAGARAIDRFLDKLRQARNKQFKKGRDPQRSAANITMKWLYRHYADRIKAIKDEYLPEEGE